MYLLFIFMYLFSFIFILNKYIKINGIKFNEFIGFLFIRYIYIL